MTSTATRLPTAAPSHPDGAGGLQGGPGAGALLGGRFTLGDVIAETDLSVVHAAVDEQTGGSVCVKMLRTTSPHGVEADAAARFRREAAILSRISHPHVVRVLAAGTQERAWFAMELLDGQSLDALLAAGALPVGRALALLVQIVDGLAHVHRHGVIHRDLKPHNIVVVSSSGAAAAVGEARIIDFGLASLAGRSDERAFAGTARYMAPEQAGLVWRAVGPRADLYAVGCIAFEMLTGKPPFHDVDAGRLLRRIQCEAPPPLRSVAQQAPVALEKIVRVLLEKNPDDRYQSAEALLRDLEIVERAWRDGARDVDLEPRRATSSVVDKLGAVFVGRQEELAQADALAADVEAGRPRALLVHGKSGAGKSAFVAEVMGRLQARGAVVVAGKCAAVHAGVPYAALDDVLGALLDVLDRLPAAERSRLLGLLREELGESSGYVTRICPAWSRVLDDAQVSAAAGARAEHERVVDAVTAMIGAVISGFAGTGSDATLVLFVDDLQWADASTVQLFRDLVDGMRGRRFLLIGAWRSEETNLRSPVRALVSLPAEVTRTVAVGPLTKGDIRALLRELLGARPGAADVPPRLVEVLHARSEGNAFFAWELLRAWCRADAFREVDGAVEVDVARVEATALPSDLVGMVLERLNELPAASRRVLGVASLVGRAFDLRLVRACAELDDDAAYEALVAARDAQVLVETGELWAFAHDKVLEACSRFIDAAEIPAMHQRIGGWLESTLEPADAAQGAAHGATSGRQDAATGAHAERLFEIALHYGASDDVERALVWAVRAADASSALLRHQEALHLYENADAIREMKGEPPTSPDRVALIEKKAAAYDALGRYAEAEAGWRRALEGRSGDDVLDTARLLAKLAQSQQKSGRYVESHDNLLRALRLLGVRVRLEGAAQPLFDALERAKVALRGAPGGEGGRAPTTREALVAELLTRLWYFHSFYLSGKNHRKMYSLAYQLLASTSALGDCREKAVAHRLMAITLCQGDAPDFDGALEHSFRSVDIARRRDAKMELAEGWLYVGIIHVWSARFSGAVEYLQKAAAMLEQIGNQWELANVHIFSFMAYKNLGRLDRALGHALELVRLARRANAAGSLVSGQSKLADALLLQGDVKNGEDALRQALALAAEKNLDFDHFMATKVEGAWLLRAGRTSEARASFERAMALNDKNTFLRAYRSDAYVGWAESVLRAPDASDADVARAHALLDEAVRLEERSRLHFVYALRTRARLWLRRGDRARAEQDAERAMTVVTREGHPFEHPYVLELHADLHAADRDRSAAFLVEARRLFLHQGAVAESARIGERLHKLGIDDDTSGTAALESARRQADALLQVSLASSSTLDPQVQARAALDELVRVFDADRGFLFVVPPGAGGDGTAVELELHAARAADGTDAEPSGWSSTVVERVRARREPIVVTGEAEGALLGSKSAVLHDLRSIVAAPLLVRDRLLGVVYLDNRIDRGVRSRDDVQLLQAIANHIAVAFETARSARVEVERHAIEKEKVLLEKDLALTGIVQSMFLPGNGARALAGVDVAGLHRPAASSGGDWWACDEVERPHARVVRVLVGDVTGHGAAPAMLTAAMSTVVRSIARTRRDVTTPEVVGELHATLVDVCKGAYQMTLAAVEIELRAPDDAGGPGGQAARGVLRWWNAGAPPLLVVKADGRVVPHTATGAPVGSERFALEARQIDLDAGDRVLVMTDGVLEQAVAAEAGGKRRPFGRKRVAQVLAGAKGAPVEDVLPAIVRALDDARGGEAQEDDVTLVLLAL